ncbi:hypothetical protein M758_1G168600 [Ceratodon purpureus]|nr:hypothetical protein M758_1G168600 [Ceratodon purpureus]
MCFVMWFLLGCSRGLLRRNSVAITVRGSTSCRRLRGESCCRAQSRDAATVEVAIDGKIDDVVPVLNLSEVTERMQSLSKTRPEIFRAMYSSVIGGITTDPAAMVIPMDDHMVHRGHGVFDTAIIYNGFLYELDTHLDRLLRSAASSKIKSPFDRATLRHILLQTVAASGCRRGSLRYWLSAGLGGFGLSSKECYKSTFYAIVSDNTYKGPEGVKVVTTTIPIKPPFFATVKSVNYLPNVLAQLEAEEQGAFTAVWLDSEGYIAEGPNMNIAVLSKDGVLLIPPFDNVLAGCTARRMLELVPTLMEKKLVAGLVGVKVQKISVQEAKSASEMMLIGSGVLVKSIIEWDGLPVGNGNVGPLTSAIREAVQRDLEDITAEKLVPVPYASGL